MVAAAVWATVLSARIAAAFAQADVRMRLPILLFFIRMIVSFASAKVPFLRFSCFGRLCYRSV